MADTTPEGLVYFPDAFTEEDHRRIIDGFVRGIEWDSSQKRPVADYESTYDQRRRTTRASSRKLPDWLKGWIVSKLVSRGYHAFSDNPIQVRWNLYRGPTGISPHVDADCFGEHIAAFTFGSGIALDYTRKDHAKFTQYVGRGSLVVMSGDSRWKWKHGIASRLADTIDGLRIKRSVRVSLTVRTVPPS